MVKGLPLHRTAGDAALERAMSASAVPSIDELYAMRELQAQHTAMKQHTRSLGALTREEAVGLLETLTSTLFSEYYDFSQARLSGKALLSATDADLKAAGIDDAVEWTSVRHKLEVLGFTESDQQQMFRLFSAVLAIGNITFKPGAAADTHQVDGEDALALAAELLQVETASHMPCTRPHTPDPTLDPRCFRWRRRRSRPSSRRR